MTITACPHYLPDSTAPVVTCRGCGAAVTNPKSETALETQQVNGDGSPRMVGYPGGR